MRSSAARVARSSFRTIASAAATASRIALTGSFRCPTDHRRNQASGAGCSLVQAPGPVRLTTRAPCRGGLTSRRRPSSATCARISRAGRPVFGPVPPGLRCDCRRKSSSTWSAVAEALPRQTAGARPGRSKSGGDIRDGVAALASRREWMGRLEQVTRSSIPGNGAHAAFPR